MSSPLIISGVVRSRLASCLLTTAVVAGLVGMVAGCDTESDRASKKVDEKIGQAQSLLNGGPHERGEAEKAIADAVKESAATADNKLYAKVMQAQFEQAAAEAMQPEIDSNQTKINRLAWEITRLTSQIDARNELAAALSKYEPSQVQAAITQQTDSIKGGEGKETWIKDDPTNIAALAKVTKDIADQQAKIGQLQEQIKSITDQRVQLLAQADQLNQKSEQLKGNESVELFKQGADAQKKASDLSVQLDQANVQLGRLQTDVAVNQGQQDALNAALKDFAAQSDAVNANWTQVNSRITDLTQGESGGSKSILGAETGAAPAENDPTGGRTIAAKGQALDDLNKKNRTLRDEAEGHLNSAKNFYGEAVTLAETIAQDLQKKMSAPENMNKSDQIAWKSMSETLATARYRLLQAGVEQKLAALFAGRAAEAQTRTQLSANLKPVLDAAKLPIPASLSDGDSKVSDDLNNGRKQADLAYQDADDLLTKVIDGASGEENKRAALTARIFTQYGWSLLAENAGDKGKANEHLKLAKETRDSLPGDISMAHLPPELAVAPPKPPAPAPAAPAAPGAPTTPAAPQ